ncbi:MAG: hypothetical protein RSG78_02270 [Oscillospiraceae bacterium]
MRGMSNAYGQNPMVSAIVSEFRGVDFHNAATNVENFRSPNALNMIRDVPGKVRKRMGFYKKAQYGARINGIFSLELNSGTRRIIHSGNKLFCEEAEIFGMMADSRSTACQMGDILYVFDGQNALRYDGTAATRLCNAAYAPTISISREPSGGGTIYEPMNLIGKRFKERFLANGTATVYQLGYDGLDVGTVQVKILNESGDWVLRAPATDYTVDYALGTITFVTAPPAPGVSGADNVEISAEKTRNDCAAMIEKCNISVLFGVNGAANRLFVSGNAEFRNRDWYSEMNNGEYFPETCYSIIGQSSKIIGYSIIDDKLAAHKEDDSDGRNIVLRSGEMRDGRAAFPIVGSLQGVGAISHHAISYLKTEPLFLSRDGIYAITAADISGSMYSQNRSIFINKRLLAEKNIHEAVSEVYKDFYLLALNGNVYVLDSLQKTVEKNAPFSTHQYEAYFLTGIDARVIKRIKDKLLFGTCTGDIMEFFSDDTSKMSYNDNGAAILAFWETPQLDNGQFYRRKRFRYIALRLMAGAVTSVVVRMQIGGIWQELFGEAKKLRFFSFKNLSFSKLTFSCDATPKTVGNRIHCAKTDKATFRFENAQKDEPFGLYSFCAEFKQMNKVK